MTQKTFTRLDFNNILNYQDVRANEFTLTTDNCYIEPEHFTGHLTSNTDVVTDFVSAQMVKNLIEKSTSYIIKIRKNYPFHEVFIEDSLAVSRKHLYAYTPTIVAACDSDVKIKGHGSFPTYIRAFSGKLTENLGRDLKQIEDETISCKGKTIFLLLQPNPKLQRELLIRMFRKKLRANASASKETFSASDREVFYKKVKESIDGNTLSATDIHLFTQTLLQLWPCGARHRLSSFILLNEKQLDIVGDLIPWNAYIDKENLHSFTGKQLPDTSVTRQIVQQGLGRFYGFERSVDVDALVLEGVIGYRRKDEWLYRGWIELVSPLDPTALVKSDGKFRWMRLPHGGIESIERLSDGKNFAIGTSFIATNFGASFYRKKALFLGLGLGVLQRHFEKDSLITTIEINPAIIEMFRQLYEQNTHEIIQGDFFSFLPNTERLFDTIVVDFFDENDKTLQPINFEQIIRHLEPGGNIFINSQGKSTDFENKVEEVSKAFQMEPNFHSLPHLQQLVQISFKTTK